MQSVLKRLLDVLRSGEIADSSIEDKMKKQDYLLFAIIIIAFIIWMYIVQKYFTVSYDELTIEEKIRYEQFMLP